MRWYVAVLPVIFILCANAKETSEMCKTHTGCATEEVCLQVSTGVCLCQSPKSNNTKCQLQNLTGTRNVPYVKRNASISNERTSVTSTPEEEEEITSPKTNLEIASDYFGISKAAFIFLFIVLPIMCCIGSYAACVFYCVLRKGAERISQVSQSSRFVRLTQGLRHIAGADPPRKALQVENERSTYNHKVHL